MLLAEYDRRIKTMLGEVFGKQNDFDALLDGVNLAGLGGNGRPVVQNLLDALAPVLQRGAQATLEATARTAAAEAAAARAARRMNAWTLPVCVTVGGQPRAVYTDYRDILYLLNWLDGPRGAALRPDERWYVALALFYRDFAALDPALYPEAAAALAAFLAAGQPAAPAGPRLIDWQKDAGLIVAGVNRAAGCEVRALPYLHWWSFIAWFAAIGEGALATVVAIREKLARGKRLEGGSLNTTAPTARRSTCALNPPPRSGRRRSAAADAGRKE